VARRVSPTERARAEIDELFASDRDLASILEEVARLSVRLLMQTALEAEVEEFLGRARYQRRTEEHRAGVRNGWQPPTAVKTTMGPVELQRPKLRATDQAFCSRLFGAGVTRTNALESLVISGWVRGLSDRDIEAALAEVLGAEAALSRSTVSRICQRIKDEFEGWRTRDLSGLRLDYPFLDASHLQDAPWRTRRAGAGRLGHRHQRQAGVRRAGAGQLRVDRRVLRQGRYLVVRVAKQLQEGPVLALATGGSGAATLLGSALEVLPSPRPDRVWLLDRRARSPQRTFALQEVELATGRRLATVALPHDAEPVAMVDGGVLVRDLRAGLAVRDLASGLERQRLGTDLTFVDATASLVAYVDDRGDLRLRDLATRRDRVVRPIGMPGWFPLGRPVAGAGCCDQFGAFSADGRRLAVYVQLRRPAQPGLAVVDVGRAEARPLPGSQAATPFGCQPCLGWSIDGWLFFFSGGPPPDVVTAWRPGRPTASPLDLPLDSAIAAVPGSLAV
jgi:putative transposase